MTAMSAVTPASNAMSAWRAAANGVWQGGRRCGWNSALFMCLAALYLLPFMRVVLPHSNEGTLIYAAVRVVHGEVFARDFFEVVGAGTIYIVAGIFKLFGVSFLATRIWLFVSSLGVAWGLYMLGRRVCPRHSMLSCLIVAGTLFGMQWPSVSHHLDSTFFGLLSVLCLMQSGAQRFAVLLYGSGVLAGVTAWVHPLKGCLLLFVAIVWMLIGAKRKGREWRACLYVLAGFSVVCLCGAGYFFLKGGLRYLFDANMLWPARHYGAVNTVPYALGLFSQYWHHWASLYGSATGWPVAMASLLIVPFLVVAVSPAITLVALVRWRSVWTAPDLMLCLLSGWAMWASEIHRADIYHLVFGSPLLLLVCVRVCDDWNNVLTRWTLRVVTASAFCLMTCNLLQVATAETLTTRVGQVAMLRPDRVLQFVRGNIPAGEEVLFYPYCPMEYFLTETRNPTRYSILVYGYNTPAQFEDAVRTLEERRVKYVVWDISFVSATYRQVFPSVAPPPADAQIMEPYLLTKYQQMASIDGYQILVRNK